MIEGSYKTGFKNLRRPLEQGEALPEPINQAELLMAAGKYALEVLGEKEYKKYHKNELNKESAIRCAARKNNKE